MTTVTVRTEPDIIDAAARHLGIDAPPGTSPAALGALVLRELAGRRQVSAIAAGGAAPKRAGRTWENTIVEHAQAAGFPWDRAPLRGARDLLDVTGCLPAGWLVGGKSTTRGVSAAVKLADAMDQCHRAMGVLEERGKADGVIPWQIIQRPSMPPGRAYAVTEYDWMLQLAQMRQEAWERR